MLLFPKPTRKARSRKRIANRSVFKAHGANPLKSYRRRFTDYQVTTHAEACRQERLRNRTEAEMAFSELLDGMRVLYEVEKIFLNGDRFVLADFYFKAQKLVIELDGSAHDGRKKYDAGRDAWLLRRYGVKTIRLSNAEVLRAIAETRTQVIGLLTT